MNCCCEHPTLDCPEHGTGCDGRTYVRVKTERDEALRRLAVAFDLLTKVRPVVANDDLHDRIEAWLVNGGVACV